MPAVQGQVQAGHACMGGKPREPVTTGGNELHAYRSQVCLTFKQCWAFVGKWLACGMMPNLRDHWVCPT